MKKLFDRENHNQAARRFNEREFFVLENGRLVLLQELEDLIPVLAEDKKVYSIRENARRPNPERESFEFEKISYREAAKLIDSETLFYVEEDVFSKKATFGAILGKRDFLEKVGNVASFYICK